MSMSHNHHHNHSHSHTNNKKVLAVSFAVIASFMLIEIIGGWLTNSLALLSDAGHMFSDVLSLGISLWAFKLGERNATMHNTFGFKRFEVLAAALNGATLVVISLMICYEAALRLYTPSEVATHSMLAIAIIGLLVNIFIAWYMLHSGDTRDNLNMRSAYLHVLSDLFGSVAAIIAAILMMVFGWIWADPIASVIVALLVLRSGWHVLKHTAHILMEGTPHNINSEALLHTILQTEGVERAHDLHIWTISSGIHALSCHIVVSENLRVAEAEQIVYQIEHALAHQNIGHVTIQVESHAHPHEDKLLCGIYVEEGGHNHHHRH